MLWLKSIWFLSKGAFSEEKRELAAKALLQKKTLRPVKLSLY